MANKISQTARQKVDEIRPHFEAELRQDGIFDWLDELDALLFDSLDEDELKHLINHHLNQTNEFNKKQFHKVLKSAYGVNIFVSEPWLNDPLALAELDNLDLIKSIPKDLHDRLRGRFIHAVRNGERWESVKADLEKLFNLPEKRATLIARDQIGKLNGQLTRLRQENIGVKSYIWRGMLDERERERHVEREGKQFNWDEPPEDGHPGQPILCRCYAEAVLPDFDELQGVIYADKPINIVQPNVKTEDKTLPKDLKGAIAVGRSIFTKYQDVIDDAMARGVPHEGIMEIMRREGVELGGMINVIGVEKRAITEITDVVKRYPKSWVEKSNEFGKVFVRESKERSYHQYINTDNHFLLLKRYKLLKKGDLYKLAKENDSLILTGKTDTLAERLSTHIHEYAHRLQKVLPDLDNYFVEFWKESTKNDRIEYLAELLSDYRYGREITKKDNFPHPYYGRIYHEKGMEVPKEMLTMTFEALLGGKVNRFDELISKNPDLFDLGLALLTRYK